MADISLEQQIIERLRSLDEAQKQRVLEFVEDLKEPQAADDWFERVEAFDAELRQKYGDQHVFGVQDMLDQIREEASWPRL